MASGIAGGIGILALNPLDTLRVRWQVASGDVCEAKTMRRFTQQIIEREGLWRGLWSPALGANFGAVFVCNSLRFSCYPLTRSAVMQSTAAEEKNLGCLALASVLAGSFSYAVAAPFYLQVCPPRYQLR